ncbi:hypothetical protein F5148DRAFT_1283358 [Russula earlei]|uniref:Uncharacterized protein n=1 Tax=Russula earlei TaxID=71964 RepID=A0ACC0UBS7_9AGAM|nr:hypothetical protein F5148DRAFT_1283358 [Russula earlei]
MSASVQISTHAPTSAVAVAANDSANNGTGPGASTASTANRSRRKNKDKSLYDPNEDSSGLSSSDGDDPEIDAMREEMMRYMPRGPPSRPAHGGIKGGGVKRKQPLPPPPSSALQSGAEPPEDPRFVPVTAPVKLGSKS